ncbi:MAG: VOC family protein [Pseudomonadota bacterium]
MTNYDVVQIAYHVPDIEVAASRFSTTYGAGPFFVSRNITLSRATHRGEECRFVHSSAYGQWGNVMVEMVQQEDAGASPFRDLYTEQESGLHHTAIMVDDLDQAIENFHQQKIELATLATTETGTTFAFLDALDSQGHFIEIYERSPGLLQFYDAVRHAAQGWDKQAPVRPVTDLL